ncbi:M20/M25/M40 family metallo-hydrolase [Gemmatimonas aurantiaca]|uniref:M20/M25/M40 family metallo-hydrolase n=1 Tax=Gemmatimonas aurantiaca TaxID=173480 RepID=UPI00301D89CF
MRHTPTAALVAGLATATLASTFLAPASHAQRGVPRTSTPSPDAEVYLVPLTMRGDTVRVGVPANLTRRAGYDNQPMFAPDSRALFYTANLGDGHTDIWRLDLSTGLTAPVRRTVPESEYSAAPMLGDTAALAVIRVEADSTQRLWRLPLGSGAPSVILPDLKPVGYFAQPDDSTWVTFVLGSPATLQVTHTRRTGGTTGPSRTLARDIGRSLHRIPGTRFVSFVQKGAQPWHVMRLDVSSDRIDTLVALPEGTEDVTWVDSTTLLAGQDTKLLQWTRGSDTGRNAWRTVGDFGFAHLARISRLAVSPNRQWLAMVAEAQPRVATAASTSAAAKWVDRIDTARVRRAIGILAADSMEGRLTGSPGMERAARWLEREYKAAGLAPAGDSGTYRQHIPLRTAQGPNTTGRVRPAPVESWAAWNALPADQRLRTQNIAGVIRGSDPVLRDEVVLVTAHYDHIGIGRPVDGDSINNGADDDASGNVALLEIARALQNGPRPKRTILFVSITGEEVGGLGTRWYLQHPLLPLEKTVVDLNIEMIAHPDSLTGGFGRAWLTGYERSTLGDLLADNGIPLMPDPRPGQSFFTRSDNAAFARIGIPAHSLSSFNLATPYHHPKDEAGIVNVAHMARVIGATARAVRLLADGDKPTWHPGGQPEARVAR